MLHNRCVQINRDREIANDQDISLQFGAEIKAI